jgi:hypothetical protein
MYDAYTDSPLWQTYCANGLIALEEGGLMIKGGVYNGLQAYAISYKNEWDSGFAKKRIDELCACFPWSGPARYTLTPFIAMPTRDTAIPLLRPLKPGTKYSATGGTSATSNYKLVLAKYQCLFTKSVPLWPAALSAGFFLQPKRLGGHPVTQLKAFNKISRAIKADL